MEGKITAKYGKRNDDDFGSFIVNGKRYYASGELLNKVSPDQFVEIEVTPHSKTLMGIN